MKPGLDLLTLRIANMERQKIWCEVSGVLQLPDLSYRCMELGGEVGEALNVAKKIEREKLGWSESRATLEDLANELADVVICADLVAITAGIDLGGAVRRKFNQTSVSVGIDVTIESNGFGNYVQTPKGAK